MLYKPIFYYFYFLSVKIFSIRPSFFKLRFINNLLLSISAINIELDLAFELSVFKLDCGFDVFL